MLMAWVAVDQRTYHPICEVLEVVQDQVQWAWMALHHQATKVLVEVLGEMMSRSYFRENLQHSDKFTVL